MSERSDLAALVETESRLDRTVAAARQAADEARAAARLRARTAASRLETEIALERERIASTLAAETARREREIEDRTRAKLARYEAMRDDAVTEIARLLARRLVAIAEEDS
jgi:hypothetical protein